MNKDTAAETIVGAIVAAVAVGFMAFALMRAGEGDSAGGYPVEARFNRVDGIAVGSDVRMAGVKVGAVSSVALDPTTYMAKVTLSVDKKVKVPTDSSAKIASDGLLGGAYISLEPGGAEEMLAANGEIEQTQGSVDLLTVLASAASSMGGGETKDEQAGAQASEIPVP